MSSNLASPQHTYLGWPKFPKAARTALDNTVQRRNLAHATSTIRAKRAAVVGEVPHWEDLRVLGARIKDGMLEHQDAMLLHLEEKLTAAGTKVHWARNGQEANKIIVEIVKAAGVDEVVKVKSMATQEIEMNEALEAEGISAWETDLAELIVQLGHDTPSHILVPAIHRNRSEIREIFKREMGKVGTPAPEGISDNPPDLAGAARVHLREKFLRAVVATSGANFMIAETGTLVVVESEGNGRMCLTLPQTLVSVVGIEKVLPTWQDLEVFLQLLPRSSTGERMNPYTSMWTGPTAGDGPQDVHVVLVDNGRTHVLADDVGRQALRCIRCSACLNICPVYERAGGHAYGSVYPGPIGAILTPQLRGVSSELDQSLPYASSLCGACYEVCPVRINIPEVLVHMRMKVVDEKKRNHKVPTAEMAAMTAGSWLMSDHRHLEWAQKAATTGSKLQQKLFGKKVIRQLPWPAAIWTGTKDVPMPPQESFRDWWARTDGGRTEGFNTGAGTGTGTGINGPDTEGRS